MQPHMHYLNNAATSYPKPNCVLGAANRALAALPTEEGRSNFGGTDVAGECRRQLAPLLGVQNPERIYFTSGATEAANLVLRGAALEGRHIVVTADAHNAVLRPLYALYGQDQITVVPCLASGHVLPQVLAAALRPHTACVLVNHCSNVTGAVQNLEAIGQIARRQGALFLVDAAQSAGAMPIDAQKHGVDALLFTGHKHLFGPGGTGGFYLRPGAPVRPAKFGGTGIPGLPAQPPPEDAFEVGTPNTAGLAALCTGAAYLNRVGLSSIQRHIAGLVQTMATGLAAIPGVTLYHSAAENAPCGGAVAFAVAGLAPEETGYILRHVYHMVVRTGQLCAPLLMQAMHTPGGVVRASVSALTPPASIAALVKAVQQISAGAGNT